MNTFVKIIKLGSVISLLSVISACSGGGGSEGENSSDGLSRGTSTAIRIMHAGIDLTPVDVRIGTTLLQSAHYAETKYYRPLSAETSTITVTRSNDPTAVLQTLPIKLKEDTEYSLFIYGQAKENRMRIVLIEDNATRPEEGACLLRVMNGYIGEPLLSLRGADFSVEGVRYGSVSEYVKTRCTQQAYSILINDRILHTGYFDLPDRSEATILLLGSKELGMANSKVFVDLD